MICREGKADYFKLLNLGKISFCGEHKAEILR